ncbi:hypothetical protein CNEO4_310031 [Clostridium neonatale]|nr:hypothetical protein CNEO3_150011 [Clostridium neonatale]CAI3614233.1 hypothetical protein CNEO4_310031 [Clostridium neonatale]
MQDFTFNCKNYKHKLINAQFKSKTTITTTVNFELCIDEGGYYYEF